MVRLADDVSCAVLPVASFITASYYVLLLTGNIVDSDEVTLLLLHIKIILPSLFYQSCSYRLACVWCIQHK